MKGQKKMKKYTGKNIENQNHKIFLRNIYHGISELIMNDHPDFTGDTVITSTDLNQYRRKYIEAMLKNEMEYAQAEEEVLDNILNREIITENSNKTYSKKKVIGQNIADSVAKFGGSWTFNTDICFYFAVLDCFKQYSTSEKAF